MVGINFRSFSYGNDSMLVEKNFKDVWKYAGETVRQRMINELFNIPLPNKVQPWDSSYSRSPNFLYTVDYSDRERQFGHDCVYACVTDKGKVFYIGSGEANRATNYSARTEEFIETAEKYGSTTYILCNHADKEVSLDIERLLINRAVAAKCPLVNRQIPKMTQAEEKYFIALFQDVVDAFDALVKKSKKKDSPAPRQGNTGLSDTTQSKTEDGSNIIPSSDGKINIF